MGSPCWVRAEGNSVGTAVLLVLLHTLGALLLHLIYCEGPTPSSAWCCHLRAERGVSFFLQAPCHHRASQSKWLPYGCSSVIGLKNWFPSRSFCSFLWQSGFGSNKVHCPGQRKHSHSMHFGNPFTEKTIVLRVKGRPWKITVASGSWR